jgi:hypothetical protein
LRHQSTRGQKPINITGSVVRRTAKMPLPPRQFVAIVVLFLVGCSRHTAVDYEPGFELSANEFPEADYSIAIARFIDARASVDPDDPKSFSFVRHQQSQSWGLEYKGQKFTPVAVLVQDALFQEFGQAGFNAILEDSEPRNYDYLLTGKILNFGYQMDQSGFASDAIWQVTFDLGLTDNAGEVVQMERVVNILEREAQYFSTAPGNIEKLVDGTFKSAAIEVVERVTAALIASDISKAPREDDQITGVMPPN